MFEKLINILFASDEYPGLSAGSASHCPCPLCMRRGRTALNRFLSCHPSNVMQIKLATARSIFLDLRVIKCATTQHLYRWANSSILQFIEFWSNFGQISAEFWSNLCKMASNRVSLIVVVQSMACWTHCTFASRTCHHLFCWPLPQANELHYVQETPAVTLGNNLIQAQLSHSSLAARLGKVIQYDTVTIWLPWMDSWKGITCACNITWSHQRQFDLVRSKGNQRIFWTIHD